MNMNQLCFVQGLHVCLCRIYDLEHRIKAPEKYLFPNFQAIHWFAATHGLMKTIEGMADDVLVSFLRLFYIVSYSDIFDIFIFPIPVD